MVCCLILTVTIAAPNGVWAESRALALRSQAAWPALDVALIGHQAFVERDDNGLRVANASDPANPQHVGEWAGSLKVRDFGAKHLYADAGSIRVVASDAFGMATSQPAAVNATQRPVQAERVAPGFYIPGRFLEVQLDLRPVGGTVVYAVEDEVPAGWQVDAIAHDGSYDAVNRKVKFGPFLDAEPRLLSYAVTPPADATQEWSCAGVAMFDDWAMRIRGRSVVKRFDSANPDRVELTLIGKWMGTNAIGNFPSGSLVVTNGFAYVAAGESGLRIIDVQDASEPTLKGTYPSLGEVCDVAISGSFAYVAERSRYTSSGSVGGGMHVLDIRDPSSPRRVAGYGGDTVSVELSGTYAYWNGFGSIMDISDPAHPSIVSRSSDWRMSGNAMALHRGLAYVSTSCNSSVVDNSNPRSPRWLSTFDIPAASGCGIIGSTRASLNLADNYLYVGYLSSHMGSRGGNVVDGEGLRIFDLLDPLRPTVVSDLAGMSAVSIATSGDYVILVGPQPAYYYPTLPKRLTVLDASNPTSPKIVGEWFESSSAFAVAASAHYAFVAATNGFFVLEIATPPPRPPRILIQPQDIAAIRGQSVTFESDAAGSSPYVFQWIKDGVPLNNGGPIIGTSSPRMIIDDLKPQDAGVYQVAVSNALGQVFSRKALLTVREPVSGDVRWMVTYPEWNMSATVGVPEVALGADGTIFWFGSPRDAQSGREKAVQSAPPLLFPPTMWTWMNLPPPVAAGANGSSYTATDGKITATDTRTGRTNWQFATGGPIYAPPVIGVDGTVFVGVGLQGTVYALDGMSGKKKWQSETGGTVRAGLAIGENGHLIVTTESPANQVCLLDAATGTIQWTCKAPAGQSFSAPAIGPDGTAYLGFYRGVEPGSVRALEGRTGQVKWVFDTGTEALVSPSAPALDNQGTLYVGTLNALYALDSGSGTRKWSIPTAGHTLSPAIGPDGGIYLTSYVRGSSRSPWIGSVYLYALYGAASLADAPWPMLMHDPQHTGQATAWHLPLRLSATTLANGQMRLQWTGFALLQQADTVTGPWLDLIITSTNHNLMPEGPHRFYRLRER